MSEFTRVNMHGCSSDCAEFNGGICPGADCTYRPDPAPAAAFAAEQRLFSAATSYALAPTARAWEMFLAATETYRAVAS